MNYQILNALVVNEGLIQRQPVYITKGVFTDSPAPDAETIDATGCYLLPGVIDTHVHFRDGGDGSNPAGDFATESRAAAAGGVTSVIDMPNTTPPTTDILSLERKEEMGAEKSRVNYAFMLGATNANIAQLLSTDPTRFAAIKLFLGSSTGNMLVDDANSLDLLFKESQKLIVAHCEDEGMVQMNLRTFKADFEGTGKESAALHPQIRNVEACYVCSYQAVKKARQYGTHLHLAHVSSATELNLLSNQDLEEKNITAEVTPNHLWFDDRDYAEHGNKIKCNPAIKSNDDRMGLWAGLYDGLLDTIGSDHAPHPIEAKLRPYFQAPSGIPSIQHTLPMMTESFFNSCTTPSEKEELIKTWLPILVAKMCHNPARLFGIDRRGYVRSGYHADATLVEPVEEGWEVTPKSLLYKCGWSPLEGMRFHSRVKTTFVNGYIVFNNGQVNDNVRGELLKFNK
ncbi:MAG: amidohydrolase family protein [Bacteroidales bacterium]|nr:amidohydrolase family protein [Bacteroidales bacterium]